MQEIIKIANNAKDKSDINRVRSAVMSFAWKTYRERGWSWSVCVKYAWNTIKECWTLIPAGKGIAIYPTRLVDSVAIVDIKGERHVIRKSAIIAGFMISCNCVEAQGVNL
jgi:hypothetical protein